MEDDQKIHRLLIERKQPLVECTDAAAFYICSCKGDLKSGERKYKILCKDDFEANTDTFFNWKMRILATAFLHPRTYLFFESEVMRDCAVAIQLEISSILDEAYSYSLPESGLR